MKNTSYIFTFLLICIFLFPAFKWEERPDGALEEYVEAIEGRWLSELQPNLSLEGQDLYLIEVKREWIYRDRVWIKVGTYCQPGLVDFLAFELRGKHLEYVAAVKGKEEFPLLYLDFVEILYEEEDGQHVIYYESVEAEGENHLNLKFNKINPTTNSLL